MEETDFLIVGAGLFGSVAAERIANKLKKKVLIIESRDHIGGNCYSEIDQETNIEFHKYGTHIFHTSSQVVWDYINQFTEINSYKHQVLSNHKGQIFKLPINLETINQFYQKNMTSNEAKDFIASVIASDKVDEVKNFEDLAINSLGKNLYEAFIKGYTEKQWGCSPKMLPASIFQRLPIRYSDDSTYFKDCKWQGLPNKGYSDLFKNLLQNKNIEVRLNTDYFAIKDKIMVKEKLIFTGPIDKFYNYKFGRLGWRSLKFSMERVNKKSYQGNSVVNYPDKEISYTRIHEPKFLQLNPDEKNKTLIIKEFPLIDNNNPYYPIRNEENLERYKKYKELSKQDKNILFKGRLGEYRYWDMDKVILSALSTVDELCLAK